MDAAKFERTIARTLARNRGLDDKAMAAAIRNAIDAVIDSEDSGAVAGEAISQDSYADQGRREPERQPENPLPPSPSAQPARVINPAAMPPPEKRLIILPGSRYEEEPKPAGIYFECDPKYAAEAEELARKVVAGTTATAMPEYWPMHVLLEIVSKNTPVFLDIRVEGSEKTIRLKRNVQAVSAINMCKLIYAHPEVIQDTTNGATADGSPTGPFHLGLSADVDFYQSDRIVAITKALETVTEKARKVYAVRNREVRSHTPIKVGSNLTYGTSDPHSETDKQEYRGTLI